MNKNRCKYFCFIWVLLCVFCIGIVRIPARAAKIQLNKKQVVLWAEDSVQLKLQNNKKKIKWSSNKKSVVSVTSKGKVKARKKGKAVVTAKAAGKKYRCKITVILGETAELRSDGVYTSKDKVALYIHTYGKLPGNYITKSQAQAYGWRGGSLNKYAPGKCIGGDRYSNYEKTLPSATGRMYYECDINTLGALQRGAERIVYSNDGLIFYTPDHYETFQQLY